MTAHAFIMASGPFGVVHIGAAEDLRRRVEEHRRGAIPGHTALHRIRTLVWFEEHPTPREAQARARRLARWRRPWKDALVVAANPEWRDIADRIPESGRGGPGSGAGAPPGQVPRGGA